MNHLAIGRAVIGQQRAPGPNQAPKPFRSDSGKHEHGAFQFFHCFIQFALCKVSSIDTTLCRLLMQSPCARM